MTKVFNVSAEVAKDWGNKYRVKVLLPDLGIYINGMMVFPPDKEHDWSVYGPSINIFGKYIYLVEFNKKLPLWAEIYEACVDIVKYQRSLENASETFSSPRPSTHTGVVIEDIPGEPINLDDIQF